MLLDRKRVKFWQKWVFLFMAIIMAGFLVMIPITRSSGCAGTTASSAAKQADADIARYKATLQTDPQNVDAWLSLGDSYQYRANGQPAGSTALNNDLTAAAAAYGKAAALLAKQKGAVAKQKLLDTYQKMVSVDLSLKDYQAASSVYGSITELSPKDANNFFDWGTVAINAGDTSTALLAFTRYLQLDPSSTNAAAVKDWIAKNAPSPTPKPTSTKGSKQ